MTRTARLCQALAEKGYDAFVVTQRPNQLYFTPHAEPVSGLPPVPFMILTGRAPIVIPGPMFYYACRDQLTNCTVLKTEIGDPPAQEQLATTLTEQGYRRVAFDALPANLAAFLQTNAPTVTCIADSNLGPALRRTKEPAELALLREAARISDLGMVAAFQAARAGATNRDVAAAAAAVMLAAGCEEAGMQVVSGLGTAYMGTGNWTLDPRRVIQNGDLVLVDMGILYHGYLGDQTRTAIVGEGTPLQCEVIETVQAAYRATRDAMRPGVRSADLYQITVDLLQAKGWRSYFPHHISHGLGLGGDLPRVAIDSEDVLQVGDTFSCEPGVYIPGIGGARFENMLYLGENGIEELTQSPVDPIVG